MTIETDAESLDLSLLWVLSGMLASLHAAWATALVLADVVGAGEGQDGAVIGAEGASEPPPR